MPLDRPTPAHLLTVLALAFGLASSGCSKAKSDAQSGDASASSTSSTSSVSGLSFLGSDFEGEISMNVSSKAKPMPPTQLVIGMKKPKYRMDTSAQGKPGQPPASGTLLLDLSTKKGYALTHPQKMAMALDFEQMKALKGQLPGGSPSTTPAAKIDKTGRKDVVAGYTCEVWSVTSDGKKADVCVAEGLAWIDLADFGLAAPELTLAAVATEANRFPLRVVTYDAKGAEETRMEATKVEKKTLDDARFTVPPDYRVMDMASLTGGLGLPAGMPSGLPVPKPR